MVRHAPGARATVDIAISAKRVRVEIVDDGSPTGGREAARALPGHGIAGMRERIGAFGGRLVAEPCPGRGFRVLAEVPVEDVP